MNTCVVVEERDGEHYVAISSFQLDNGAFLFAEKYIVNASPGDEVDPNRITTVQSDNKITNMANTEIYKSMIELIEFTNQLDISDYQKGEMLKVLKGN